MSLVTEQGLGSTARWSRLSGHGRDAVDQGQGLRDVVAEHAQDALQAQHVIHRIGPGLFCGQGGSNGSINAHSSSSTIHG
ncbi:hypothetical protein ACQEVY_12435 [Streptomyces sp. CA-288835]|uniref:hypothetical protein n=1 Tax=Streptomyces sp. CA-288835 TaxID=3240069 RepID=UPI003D92F0DB